GGLTTQYGQPPVLVEKTHVLDPETIGRDGVQSSVLTDDTGHQIGCTHHDLTLDVGRDRNALRVDHLDRHTRQRAPAAGGILLGGAGDITGLTASVPVQARLAEAVTEPLRAHVAP